MHSNTEMEDFAYRGKLFDFYGELLSPRQKDIYEMNVERDMSLSEIAEVIGISRQGVHSALQKTERSFGSTKGSWGSSPGLTD